MLGFDDEKNDGEIFFGAEKREYPRVPMNAPVRYRVLGKDEADKALGRFADTSNLLQQFAEAETANVSKNGIAMYTNEEVPTKSFMAVNMHFSIPGIAANCKAIAEVIRRDKSDNDKYKYIVALKFIKITHHNLKNYKFLDLKNLLDINDPSAG
jgi:c-di-GMP-binding flagellar brake protein YcgR